MSRLLMAAVALRSEPKVECRGFSGAPLAIGAGGARGGGEVTFAACWCADRITPGIQHVGATRW